MSASFPFLLTLNTSTLRPYRLSVPEQIRVAADAGFSGIELWVRDIQAFVAEGGSPGDLRAAAESAGIRIVNGIAFFKWADSDPEVRREGLDQARREIALLASIGCEAVAAPPSGNVDRLSPAQIGENFAALAPLARNVGVEPLLEFWGRAAVLHSIADAGEAAESSGVANALLLLDLFHMYTGGSTVAEVPSLRGRIGLVHINDYPAEPPRARIKDSERVMPGDGIGPVGAFLNALRQAEFGGPLSVELFREDYGEPDAAGAARQACRKTVQAWEKVSG